MKCKECIDIEYINIMHSNVLEMVFEWTVFNIMYYNKILQILSKFDLNAQYSVVLEKPLEEMQKAKFVITDLLIVWVYTHFMHYFTFFAKFCIFVVYFPPYFSILNVWWFSGIFAISQEFFKFSSCRIVEELIVDIWNYADWPGNRAGVKSGTGAGGKEIARSYMAW